MTVRTLTRPVDTTTIRSKPASALSGLSYLEVQAGDAFGWLHFPIPFSRGATVISAKLRLHSYDAPAAARTLSVRRADSRVNFSTMTWDNRPAASGVIASASSATSTAGQLWEFDVTAIMQEVSDGALWWGVRVESDSASVLRLHSTQSLYGSSRPVLVVEWADEPDAPGDLAPSGGLAVGDDKPTLRFTYSDHGGSTELAAVQVQIASNVGMTAGLWDSGEVLSSLPELDLSATSYPGMPSDESAVFWRAKVKDAAGLWSGWSDVAEAWFKPRGLVAITEPLDGASLMDPTPVVRWTFTGEQAQFQVVVQRGDKVRVPVWDSGRREGADTSFTVPAGILRDDKTYTITVRVWDFAGRASVPEAPAYRQQSATVWFDEDLATPAPEAITVAPRGWTPFVDLSWTASSTPDAFMVTRDGVILGRFEPSDVEVEPGVYEWTDRTCPPGVEVLYRVHSIVAGKRSVGRGQYAVAKTAGVWLTTPDLTVCLTGKDVGSPTLGARETVHEVGGRVVVITDGLRGHEGDWSGELHSDITIAPGVTAKEWRDRLMQIRENPKGVRLHMGPVNVPVTLAGLSVRSNPEVELAYAASFTYYQLPGPELDDITTVG